MEAKSKAIELRDKHAKFQTYTVGFEVDAHSEFVRLQRAKQSALITVEEILEAHHHTYIGTLTMMKYHQLYIWLLEFVLLN